MLQTISEEQDAAIDRLKDRLEKGVPPLMEANAHDLPLLLRAVVILREHNVGLAQAVMELTAIVDAKSKTDALAMGLGRPKG